MQKDRNNKMTDKVSNGDDLRRVDEERRSFLANIHHEKTNWLDKSIQETAYYTL